MVTVGTFSSANSWDVELEIEEGELPNSISLRFGGDLNAEFQSLISAGFEAAIGSSVGPRVPSSLIEAEFTKPGETTIKYNLLFVHHHSGALARINTLRRAKSFIFPPSEVDATTH